MNERLTGRKNNELRKIEIIKDYTKHAAGSVLISFGDTKVLVTASIEEGRPKWMDKEDKRGWITAEYSMLPSAALTRTARERAKISGRTHEIQRLIGRSLRACVNLEKLGDRTVIIDADVLQADGGTRCASICGGFIAMNTAFEKLIKQGVLEENPVIETIAAVSIGIIDGEIRVDLDYSEDSRAQADCNIVMAQSSKIIEFQASAEGALFDKQQLDSIYSAAQKAVQEIIGVY